MMFLLPVGDPQECPVLPNPSNGRIKYSRGRRVEASIWYACDSGYTLIGSESHTFLRKAIICCDVSDSVDVSS